MVNPHHLAHWYPTAAYLYVFWLDALALAWEYLGSLLFRVAYNIPH